MADYYTAQAGADLAGQQIGQSQAATTQALAQYGGMPGGAQASDQLTKLLTPGADASAILANTPGYQFQIGQGVEAIQRSAAGRGMLQSGNMMAELAQYGQGLASSQYYNYMNLLQSILQPYVSQAPYRAQTITQGQQQKQQLQTSQTAQQQYANKAAAQNPYQDVVNALLTQMSGGGSSTPYSPSTDPYYSSPASPDYYTTTTVPQPSGGYITDSSGQQIATFGGDTSSSYTPGYYDFSGGAGSAASSQVPGLIDYGSGVTSDYGFSGSY